MDSKAQIKQTLSEPLSSYIPRGQNVLQTVFKEHFDDFREVYDEKYSKAYGKYRIDRITEVVEEFLKCGDYREGLARIKCTNSDCGHDYFVPLSCKGFYLCPSCHQKRTLLFAEQITQEALLRLPRRQWVFCIPKCLRVFFKHDRMLFSDISRLIFKMLQSFYDKVSANSIQSGAIIAYESAGDFLRWNAHWHGLVLEGGFDEGGRFVYLPISDTKRMTELFRRLVIKCFHEKKLITEGFARNLLSWKNSGFSIDNSIRIYGNDHKAREALSQYIAKPPVSLEKIHYEPFHGKVLYKTPKYNEYFGQSFKFFDALDFIAEVTAHIPPKGKQYIRRYGLYSSRVRGLWQHMQFCVRLAPQGWKDKHLDNPGDAQQRAAEMPECGVEKKVERSTWARLIKRVYGTDPLVCPHCGSEMKILAIIVDAAETEKILTTFGCLAPGQDRPVPSSF